MADTRCTWIDCNNPATHPQVGTDGKPWAMLCDEHHEMMDSVQPHRDFDAKKLLSYWVKAQGGSKKAAERMMR